MPRVIGPTIPRWTLGKELREMREAAGKTRDEVAANFDWSEGKVRTIELGQVGLDKPDLAALLAFYGQSGKAAELDELRRQSKERGYWVKYGPISKQYANYIGLESAAQNVKAFDLAVINGLLQTEDYARAVITATRPDSRPEENERLVKLRTARQDRLTGDDPVRCWAIMDEAALRRVIGGPAVMRAQCQRLLELTELPNIQIQVLPFKAGAHPGTLGSFTILEFPAGLRPPAVYVEGQGGDIYLEKDEDLHRCTLSYTHMCAAALSQADSGRLIAAIARELA
ncbi:MAG: helix-turn-helix domain-containing protein [Micromonosporaceae bacterium]